MSTEESAFGQETLAYYGNPLESYCGKGSLTLEDERKADCAFAAGQLRNGKVVLLCALPSSFDFGTLDLRVPAKRFEGTTAEGFRIWAEDLFEINYLPDPPANATGTWAAFRVRKMSVNVSKVDLAQTAHFGLTNFDFIGSEWRSNGDSWYKVLPFSLQCGENTIELAVVPVTGHHRALNRLRTLKGIDVTCEVTAPIPEGGGTERLTQVVDDLCHILSVARGTKIQWVYCYEYNADEIQVSRTHYSRITSPYCSLKILSPAAVDETKKFVENAYPLYVARRESYELDRGTIGAYLEGKAGHDALETRGAKMALALERLKAVLVKLDPARGHVVQNKAFRTLVSPIRQAMKDVLKTHDINDPEQQDAICSPDKIKGLNRATFRNLVVALCHSIGLKVDESDLKRVVRNRNSLVHSGRFACKPPTPQQRSEYEASEYFFLVSFLDRVFLKLFGYGDSEPYIDWRRSPGGGMSTESNGKQQWPAKRTLSD